MKTKFNKRVLWMLAAILICGASVFTSCTKQDNPVNPVDNLSEKIIGKWIAIEKEGLPAITNTKVIITFVSTTKAYVSASRNDNPEAAVMWDNYIEADVTISGNKVMLTSKTDEHTTKVDEFTVTAIDDREFSANHKITISVDGNVVISAEDFIRFTKITADYREAVLGLWECTELTGIETYNDANARLEFLADGTYRYYRMDDGGQWQTVTTREFQDYFVDGTLLATRWKNKGEDELREWWEIESISGNEMVWTALREKSDHSTVQQKMTWKKIDLNIPEKIIGKWMVADRDGKPALTDEKTVLTFLSDTKATVSLSKSTFSETMSKWMAYREYAAKIDGNKITLTGQFDTNRTVFNDYIISSITDNEILASISRRNIRDGQVIVGQEEEHRRFVRVTVDFSADIIGTWEGHCTSEGSVFDDGQEHRWQYNADGTYVYYVKDGNNWVPYATNTLNEYFVDGNLLCTRWIDQGQENREWWEISLDGDKMNWTALRQKEDGSTFTATFEMTKVHY